MNISECINPMDCTWKSQRHFAASKKERAAEKGRPGETSFSATKARGSDDDAGKQNRGAAQPPGAVRVL